MSLLIYLIISILLSIFIFFIVIKNIEVKINNLEYKIKHLFLERTSLVPSIFEISKTHFSMHNDIFNEILKLRKVEFTQNNNDIELNKIIHTKSLINHEINFIFKVFNKHSKLTKEGNFIYLRHLVIKKNNEILINLEKYKKIVKLFNKLIFYKNITII
jgi:hypothetical protein